MRAPPAGPEHLPKAAPSSAITLGVRISACEFGGDLFIFRPKQHCGEFLRAGEILDALWVA